MGKREIRGFSAILAQDGCWHLEKSRAWAENGKSQFPGARGPKTETKSYHAIRDGCPQLFYISRFGRQDPQGGKTRNTEILGYFGPGRPLALRETPSAGKKTQKYNFAALGVLKSEEKFTMLSGMVVHNFLPFYVLPDRSPMGGKIRVF